VLEVATICVQTGLNPARHILESPCQYVRCYCLNFFGDVCFQGVYSSWFVLVNKRNHAKNKTNPQPNDRVISREERQAGNRLASWRTVAPCHNNQAHYIHILQTYSSPFLTQRRYSCSNFVAISSLGLELLKKCRVR